MVGEVDSWLNAVELKELFRSGHFCCEEGCEKWLFERENERDNIHCIPPPPKKNPQPKKKAPHFVYLPLSMVQWFGLIISIFF
jgi:hypothetical protein